MRTLIVVLPLLPAMVGVVIALFGWRTTTAWTASLSSTAIAVIGAVLAVDVLDSGPITALGDQVRIDALSCLMIILIGTVAALTSTYGIAYLATELQRGDTTPRRARLYGVLTQVTIAAMVVVVSVDDLGVMWVAIEATTIATVLLVGHRRDRAAIEASWKYLILGSVGIATALLGTVLIYFVARSGSAGAPGALQWSSLVRNADSLDPNALRLGVGLVMVGYGTKAGLAPLHSWLPDAYSQAPAPVAGLMAGVVSAMSIYALLRIKVVADLALGDDFVRGLLLAAALISLVVAAALMITQRDYKRLLAYSSIEHVGLIALAAAIGSPLAMSAALLHLVGNGVLKSVTFGSAGEIAFASGSTRISDVTGLLHRHQFVGVVFALGIVGLVGLPPFSILASEVAIVRSGVDKGLTWAIAIALAVMMVIFTAVGVHALDMLTGDGTPAGSLDHTTSMTARLPLVAGLVIAASIGITIWPGSDLLHTAAEILAP